MTKEVELGRRVYGWRTLHKELNTLSNQRDSFPGFMLYCFRHGQTTANRDGIVSGLSDVPLTERGRIEALQIYRLLPQPVIYTLAVGSTLPRSKDTLFRALGQLDPDGNPLPKEFPPLNVESFAWDARIRERSLGVLEGKPAVYIPELENGDLSYAPEGGDSYLIVAQRVLSFVVDLWKYIHALPSSTTSHSVLLCSHAGPLRVLRGWLNQCVTPKEVTNLSIRSAELHMSSLNRSHLQWPAFLPIP